jgi:hypothetical protein
MTPIGFERCIFGVYDKAPTKKDKRVGTATNALRRMP